MTKSKLIMELYDGVRTTAEIAKIVGCVPSYVRVVARQRKGKGRSKFDRRYYNDVIKHGDKAKARVAWRRAYRLARENGWSVAEARRHGVRAYERVRAATGRLARYSREAAE